MSIDAEKAERYLIDIIENIDRIDRYVADLTLWQFEKEEMVIDAVERCLLRIAENATRLGEHAADWMPQQEWSEMRKLGNRLRHRYESIQLPILWAAIKQDFPSLRLDCRRTIERLRSGEIQIL